MLVPGAVPHKRVFGKMVPLAHIALVTLVICTCSLVLSMRYSRSRPTEVSITPRRLRLSSPPASFRPPQARCFCCVRLDRLVRPAQINLILVRATWGRRFTGWTAVFVLDCRGGVGANQDVRCDIIIRAGGRELSRARFGSGALAGGLPQPKSEFGLAESCSTTENTKVKCGN